MFICTAIHMKVDDLCEIVCTDEKAVAEVKSKMLDENILIVIADNFKIFGDPTRSDPASIISKRTMCL